MLLHIGGDVLMDSAGILMILDWQNAAANDDTRRAVAAVEEKSRVIYTGGSTVRSVIIGSIFGEAAVCYSPVAPSTLKKRISGGRGRTDNT